MIKTIKTALIGIACAIILATSAVAATNAPAQVAAKVEAPAQPWSFELAGSGSTSVNGDSQSVIGGTFALGRDYTLLLPAQIGVRQTLGYATEGASFVGNTELFQDWSISYKRLVLFAGGSVSYSYGDTANKWMAGPEAGVKFFVKDDVYMFGRANYDLQVSDRQGTEGDGIRYTLGLGFKF